MVLKPIHETLAFIWLFGGCGAAKQHSFFWSRISYEVLLGRGYEEKPGISGGPFILLSSDRSDLEVHTTHPAHAAATRRHAGAAGVLLRQLGNHGFGGDQESRDR